MQNRYAADIGDFSKFQLLLELLRLRACRIGLNWYLYPDESHNSDGRHLGYLEKPIFNQAEPELCAKLREVKAGQRSVAALEAVSVLGSNTRFFSEQIPLKGGSERTEWFSHSMQALAGSEILIADPDNGFLPASVGLGSRKYGKYIESEEVVRMTELAKLVVVYHHFGRNGSHREQMERMRAHCLQLTSSKDLTLLRFKSYSPRLYVMLSLDPDWHSLSKELGSLLSARYPGMWEI